MLTSAVIPSPADPGIIAIGAAAGAVCGRVTAWALGYNADRRIRWAVNGSYYGTGISFGLYLIVNFLEVGFI